MLRSPWLVALLLPAAEASPAGAWAAAEAPNKGARAGDSPARREATVSDTNAPAEAAARAAPPDASQVVPCGSISDYSVGVKTGVSPVFHLTFAEAENFTIVSNKSVAEARPWAHSANYFSMTVANSFHSRRGYLHLGGPEATSGGVTCFFCKRLFSLGCTPHTDDAPLRCRTSLPPPSQWLPTATTMS